ncbi:transglutaminase TgpA family protein, partial [Georgenia yuyongxinii]
MRPARGLRAVVAGARSPRARWADGALAALATAVATWPITLLLADESWVPPTLLALAVVAVAGALARGARLGAVAVLAVQTAAVALVVSWMLLPGHHWFLLPRPTALVESVRLVAEGIATIRDEAVPVSAARGMVFLVVAAATLVGLAVDAIAVGRRAPALAGLPLLAVVTIGASGTGNALHPKFFLAGAVAWLLLVAHQGVEGVRGWRHGDAHTDDDTETFSYGHARADRAVGRGARGYARWARAVGAAAVVLAVVVPLALPHLPPTVVVQGLVRAAGPADQDGVTFTDSLDLAADLGSRSTRPVLQYRTDDPQGTPLRVTVSTSYAGGRWLPWAEQPGPPQLPPRPTGVETDDFSLTVFRNEMRAPQVAVPATLTGADFGQLEWGTDQLTGAVVVADQPASYAATYWKIVGELPSGTGEGEVADVAGVDPATLQADPVSAENIAPVVLGVTAGAENQVQAAMAIQSYLRGSAFSYSLTLADPVLGPDGNPLDPISHFLATKVGYCVQFATTMVMMSRAIGIPARLAVGFLPGAEGEDGTRTVVAADAHAWPELFIDGLGWTRFEPTPGGRSGTAPVYRTPGAPITPAPGPTATPTPAPETLDDALTGRSGADQVSWWEEGAGRVLGGIGLGVLLTLVAASVPLAGRWRRGALRRRADDDAARVEGEWRALTASLADLGLPAPPAATPRQSLAHYERVAALDPMGSEALARAAGRLEAARYAPGGTGVGTMVEDVRTVTRQARGALPWRARVRAALWPRSGADQMR